MQPNPHDTQNSEPSPFRISSAPLRAPHPRDVHSFVEAEAFLKNKDLTEESVFWLFSKLATQAEGWNSHSWYCQAITQISCEDQVAIAKLLAQCLIKTRNKMKKVNDLIHQTSGDELQSYLLMSSDVEEDFLLALDSLGVFMALLPESSLQTPRMISCFLPEDISKAVETHCFWNKFLTQKTALEASSIYHQLLDYTQNQIEPSFWALHALFTQHHWSIQEREEFFFKYLSKSVTKISSNQLKKLSTDAARGHLTKITQFMVDLIDINDSDEVLLMGWLEDLIVYEDLIHAQKLIQKNPENFKEIFFRKNIKLYELIVKCLKLLNGTTREVRFQNTVNELALALFELISDRQSVDLPNPELTREHWLQILKMSFLLPSGDLALKATELKPLDGEEGFASLKEMHEGKPYFSLLLTQPQHQKLCQALLDSPKTPQVLGFLRNNVKTFSKKLDELITHCPKTASVIRTMAYSSGFQELQSMVIGGQRISDKVLRYLFGAYETRSTPQKLVSFLDNASKNVKPENKGVFSLYCYIIANRCFNSQDFSFLTRKQSSKFSECFRDGYNIVKHKHQCSAHPIYCQFQKLISHNPANYSCIPEIALLTLTEVERLSLPPSKEALIFLKNSPQTTTQSGQKRKRGFN